MTRILLVISIVPVLVVGCQERPRTEDATGPLRVHVGGTMNPMIERLGRVWTKKTGQDIEINSAGSGELLAHIQGQEEGDLYVCHDPFLDILMQKYNLGVDGWTIGELTPVIVVQKGNPKNIQGLRDLTRDDVEVWLTDYQRSTLGRMLPTIFEKIGIDFAQLNQQKQINTNKSGGYVANMVVTGNADAAMCWHAVAVLRTDSLDIIELPKDHLPTPAGKPDVDTITSATGKDYPLTPVRVTVATLTCSDQPKAAQAFAEFLASPDARDILQEMGYTMNSDIIRKEYENGKRIAP